MSNAAASDFDVALAEQFKAIAGVRDRLRDLDSLRIDDMNRGRISVQIISHVAGPGAPSLKMCEDGNDQLAAAVAAHPERFAGFAVLPVADPVASAVELERAVTQLGFVGALIDNHADGQYFDGSEYDPLWQVAEKLDVPVYLHPTWPAESMMPSYTGNFTVGASMSLGASGWGWHADTGLHVLRLFAAGVFDRFPRLKVILGHFGEMIPYQLERIYVLSQRWGERQRSFQQVWKENIWITTSGVWSLNPMRCLLLNTAVDHILYSVDYPFANNESGLKWLQELESSNLVTPEQLEMIAYKNSEKLLRVKVPVTNGTAL